MEKADIIDTVLRYPDSYLETQAKSLDARLDSLRLTEEDYKRLVIESNKKQMKGVGKELAKTILPPFAVAIETLEWNQNVDNDLKDAKKTMLLTDYLNKADAQEEAIKNLKEAMSNLYGNTLVNKIFQMLDNYPPDADLMKHLVTSLKKICENKNFEKLFQDHKFFLGTIEKLSPQALSIITDYPNWPAFSFQFTGMSLGNNIPDQYQEPFATKYLQTKSINDTVVKQRTVYVIEELRQQGFIKCVSTNPNDFVLLLTDLGSELYGYLN